MRKLCYFKKFAGLFSFKTIIDEQKNEYVVFLNNPLQFVKDISDRTAFEALENHVHLVDKVKRNEFNDLIAVGETLGKALLATLKQNYPQKHFYVFVSIDLKDSFIIRFHQQWKGEEPYCDPASFTDASTTRMLMFNE
jgi:hypothetical protein